MSLLPNTENAPTTHLLIKRRHTCEPRCTSLCDCTTFTDLRPQLKVHGVNTNKKNMASPSHPEKSTEETTTREEPMEETKLMSEQEGAEMDSLSDSDDPEEAKGAEQPTKRRKKALSPQQTIEKLQKKMDKLQAKMIRSEEKAELEKSKWKQREEKLRTRLQTLRTKKHMRRSPGTKVKQDDTRWVKALRQVSDENGVSFTIYAAGTEGYARAIELNEQWKKEEEGADPASKVPVPVTAKEVTSPDVSKVAETPN